MESKSDNCSAQGAARHSKTRGPEAPGALFGGELVNGKMLRRDYLNNIPVAALRKLVRNGMPVVRVPGSQRYWFRPKECLDWFTKHEVQLNQPRKAG